MERLVVWAPRVLSLLRIVAALLFMEHGLMKLFHFPAAQPGAPDDARVAQAMKRLPHKAPIALRIASELIDRGADLPIEDALELELDHVAEIFSTKDAYEGLSSLGKRRPVFKGF